MIRKTFTKPRRSLRSDFGYRLAIGAGLLASLMSLAHAGDESSADAKAWLQRMTTSLATRNYDARFVHLVGGRAENMRIVHRIENGAVTERLVSLDGSGREVIRTESEVACYLPDKRAVLVEKRSGDSSLWRALPAYSEGLQANYELASVGATRVLDRPVQLIVVKPRDQYRYGYRLWLDKDTAIPLKSQLCDSSGQVIEQIVLSSLSTPESLDAALVRPGMSTEGFAWLRQQGPLASFPQLPAARTTWQVIHPPQGFRVTVTRLQTIQGKAVPVRHLVLTDGLASVSVFIEPPLAQSSLPSQTDPNASAQARTSSASASESRGEVARIGSALAYSVQIQEHRITAVGEVPESTLRAIASGVQLTPSASNPAEMAIDPRRLR